MRLRFVPPLGLLLVATAPVGAAPRARPAPALASTPASTTECRPQDRIELNLATWKAALKRAETPQRHAEVLGEVKLSLDVGDAKMPAGLGAGAVDDASAVEADDSSHESPEQADGPTPVPARITLLSVDDTLVQLGAGMLPDHLIQVRYRIQRGDEKITAYLIQVARPFGGPSWCLLGSELSRQDTGKARLESYDLAFVPLVNAKAKAIEVKIGQVQLRHSETIRQYWVADGFRLRKVFDQEIGHMDNIGASAETLSKSGTIALIGEFPRRIELKETNKRVICDARNDEAPCLESERASTTIFVYDGKVYARRK